MAEQPWTIDATAAELVEALRTALSRLDHHMGDTDPPDENDPDLLACQAINALLAKAARP